MPSTSNSACFTHLCGNCPCTSPDSIKMSIGSQLRTPKKGDKKRWKDFIIYMYSIPNDWFKTQIVELNLLEKFEITAKMLTGRSTYKNYSEHRQSVKHTNNNRGTNTFNLFKLAYTISRGKAALIYQKQLGKENVSQYLLRANAPDIKQYLDNEKRKADGRSYIDVDKVFAKKTDEEKRAAILETWRRNTPDVFRK